MNDATQRQMPTDGEIAAALRALPTLAPPDSLQARLHALSAAQTAPRQQPVNVTAAGLMAASLVIAALLIWRAEYNAGDGMPQISQAQPDADDSMLPTLQAESVYLDNLWSRMAGQGRVQRVGTASTITALEDRVALIDAQLSQPQVQADGAGSALLWRQRVGLMNTLVALRGQPVEPVWL